MGLMDGKTAVIFGVANRNSIAWGIAQRLHEEGARIGLSYAGEALRKRVLPLAESIGCDFAEPCDVTDDTAIDSVFAKASAHFGTIDALVHSLAYAPRDDLDGRMVDVSRVGFQQSLDISAYSLIALSRRALPLMPDGGSILSMTYYAAEKVIPRYNAMAIAKAALELITKYLAAELGAQNVRVNAISAGAIKTLAAAGIPGFRDMLRFTQQAAPLRSLVHQRDVGDAALFLSSDLSRQVSGEILHVDAGYNILGSTITDEMLAQLKQT